MLSGIEVEAAHTALSGQATQGLQQEGGDSPVRRKASHRRRYLSLIAQKGAQMMLLQQSTTPAAAALPEGWLGDAWALLAAAAVQFRRHAAPLPYSPSRCVGTTLLPLLHTFKAWQVYSTAFCDW